jgi:hypothetical protein
VLFLSISADIPELSSREKTFAKIELNSLAYHHHILSVLKESNSLSNRLMERKQQQFYNLDIGIT